MRKSGNRDFICKSEYYNDYYGNRKQSLDHNNQVLLLLTNTYHPSDKVQNIHVPCKTYNLKLLHFIKTNALLKYDNKVCLNADLAKI